MSSKEVEVASPAVDHKDDMAGGGSQHSLPLAPAASVPQPTGSPPPPGPPVLLPSISMTLMGGAGPNHPSSGAPGLAKPGLVRTASSGSANTLTPSLVRSNSSFSLHSMASVENWRSFLAIEERAGARQKMRDAYLKHCPTYDELLETVVAIEEELLHQSAPNRLEYFKSAIEWDNRIQIKRKMLQGQIALSSNVGAAAHAPSAGGAHAPPSGASASASASLKRHAEDSAGGPQAPAPKKSRE